MHACWVAPLRREEFSAHWREFEIRIYTDPAATGSRRLRLCTRDPCSLELYAPWTNGDAKIMPTIQERIAMISHPLVVLQSRY